MLDAAPPLFGSLLLAGVRPGLLIFELNLSDWGFILLANAIVFGLLGKRLAADVRGWMAALGVGQTGRPARGGGQANAARSLDTPDAPSVGAALASASAQPAEDEGEQHEE